VRSKKRSRLSKSGPRADIGGPEHHPLCIFKFCSFLAVSFKSISHFVGWSGPVRELVYRRTTHHAPELCIRLLIVAKMHQNARNRAVRFRNVSGVIRTSIHFAPNNNIHQLELNLPPTVRPCHNLVYSRTLRYIHVHCELLAFNNEINIS